MATIVTQLPLELYAKMQHYDFTSVQRTLVEDSQFSEEKAASMTEAFMQWFSLVPTIEAGNVYVMLKGDIDEVFHAGVLNSAWYRDFCDTFAGEFIDHSPMDAVTREQLGDAVWYTVNLLEAAYGDQLHPALAEWRQLVESGNYKVSCNYCPDDGPAMGKTVVGHLTSGAKIVH